LAGDISKTGPPLSLCVFLGKFVVMSKVLLLLLASSTFFQGLLLMRFEAGFELVKNNDTKLLMILFLVP
jgi:hypothetical protein